MDYTDLDKQIEDSLEDIRKTLDTDFSDIDEQLEEGLEEIDEILDIEEIEKTINGIMNPTEEQKKREEEVFSYLIGK